MFQDVVMLHEKYGVNIFQNQADTFGLHPKDAEFLELLSEYRKEHPNITLVNNNAFFVRIFFDFANGSQIKTGFISLLKDAGFKVLTLAVETFAQRFNRKIDFKQITLEMIRNLIAEIKKAGLKVELYMVYAFPGQTREEIVKDKTAIRELLTVADSVVWRSLTYFPGTEYYRFLMTKMPESEYREKIANGVGFYNLVEEFNFSDIPTSELKAIVQA